MAAVCLLMIAAAAGGLPLYVHPQLDTLRHADAILVLGGDYRERYPFGLALASQGWADTVVMSNPNARRDPWLKKHCADPPPGITVHCFAPDPPTTKGEGRELRKMAAQFGWRTVIVVTFTPHISRARFILQRCFDGDLVMVASPARLSLTRWPFEYGYQTAGYLRAALEPGC